MTKMSIRTGDSSASGTSARSMTDAARQFLSEPPVRAPETAGSW